ncbi:unnamed protein product [Somion occarium]|uniref:Uncharacterized protein n=1 Tax=Somion occarium TaxID=3059160 RepID=A0ABP1DQN9_9APHY
MPLHLIPSCPNLSLAIHAALTGQNSRQSQRQTTLTSDWGSIHMTIAPLLILFRPTLLCNPPERTQLSNVHLRQETLASMSFFQMLQPETLKPSCFLMTFNSRMRSAVTSRHSMRKAQARNSLSSLYGACRPSIFEWHQVRFCAILRFTVARPGLEANLWASMVIDIYCKYKSSKNSLSDNRGLNMYGDVLCRPGNTVVNLEHVPRDANIVSRNRQVKT